MLKLFWKNGNQRFIISRKYGMLVTNNGIMIFI